MVNPGKSRRKNQKYLTFGRFSKNMPTENDINYILFYEYSSSIILFAFEKIMNMINIRSTVLQKITTGL